MDFQDDNSLHSSSFNSSESQFKSFRSSSQHASSASSSNDQPRRQIEENHEENDRYEDNTIGFDNFSEKSSHNPLNQGFIANEDSFYSENKSLYSNKSRIFGEQFSSSLQEKDAQNSFDQNSFSSCYSYASSHRMPSKGRKNRSRQRSREKPNKLRSEALEFNHSEDANFPFAKKPDGGFKKKK